MPESKPIVDQLFEERGSQYGDIRDMCHLVGAFKQAMSEVYIQEPLTSTQEVCLDMVLQKAARIVTGTHFSRIDSGDDGANYMRFIADAARILCGQEPQVIGPYLSPEMRKDAAANQGIGEDLINAMEEAAKENDKGCATAEVEAAKRYGPDWRETAQVTEDDESSPGAIWSHIRISMSRFMNDMGIPKSWTSEQWHYFKDFHKRGVLEELEEYKQATNDVERLDAVIDALLFACQHEMYQQHRLPEVNELLDTLLELTDVPYAAIQAVIMANRDKTVGPVAKRGNYPYDLVKPHDWQAPDLSPFVEARA